MNQNPSASSSAILEKKQTAVPGTNFMWDDQPQVVSSAKAEIHECVQAARRAQANWGQTNHHERIRQLKAVMATMISNKKSFARSMSMEMGKPINESENEMEDGFECIQWYLEHVHEALKATTDHQTQNEIHEKIYRPNGVTACIVAWNFPFLNFVWSVIPNLLAGNTVVFKHSEYTSMAASYLEGMMNAHLPKGVFATVYGDREVGKELINADIDQICFTGSSETGQSIQTAAHQRTIAQKRPIKVHTELGGSAPGIVFDDVDLEATARLIVKARFDNCGQVCDGLKRLIVHENVFDKMFDELMSLLSRKIVGDPTSMATHIGPLVHKNQLNRLEEQVEDARRKGAQVHTAAIATPRHPGSFYLPTLITSVSSQMKVWREEVFGPVLPMVPFSTTQEAIDLANDTVYGLGGYIYTNDPQRMRATRTGLQAGMVSCNGACYIRPHVPFTSGGYGLSGNGTYNGLEVFRQLSRVQITAYPHNHCDNLDQMEQLQKDAEHHETHDEKGDSFQARKQRAHRKLTDIGILNQNGSNLASIKAYDLPLKVGEEHATKTFKISLFAFNVNTPQEDPYYVAAYGQQDHFESKPPLVRLQSLCPHGHYFLSAHCDCASQRDLALKKITEDEVGGVLIIGAGEKHAGRGIGQVMIAGLYSYGFYTGRDVVTESFNDLGFNRDERNFERMLEVVRTLGIRKIRLLTNNPDKIQSSAQSEGIEIVEVVSLTDEVNRESLKERILLARSGHVYDRQALADRRLQEIEKNGQDPLNHW